MRKSLLALGCLLSLVVLGSCAEERIEDKVPVDQIGELDREIGGRACLTSADCSRNKTCTTEVGDCRNAPNRCARLGDCESCYGVCAELEQCGDVVCGEGQVCCNSSCNMCSPPDGVCTALLCDEVLSG